MTKYWDWFNKKKTIIGTISLMVSKAFPEHTVTHQILNGIGVIFGSIGIAHKLNKKDIGSLPSGIDLVKVKKIISDSLKEK